MKWCRTTTEVFLAIREAHPNLDVFGSFSNPEPSELSQQRIMVTVFGLPGSSLPLIKAETTWDGVDESHTRINEQHRYCLYVNNAIGESD